jgi:hypothetical protein
MDPIERYVSCLPSSGCVQWCLHRSFSGETSKLVNLVSLEWDTYLCKTTQFFYVFTLKNSQRVLINYHKSFIQNQNVRDAYLFLQEKENHLCKFVTKPSSQNHCRTEVPTINICTELSHFDQRVKLWLIYVWIHKEP